MEKEFVTYEQALELKELGFNEPCFGWWFVDEKMLFIEKSKKSTSDNILQAPLKQQVFRWFRDNHNLFGCIDLQSSNPSHWYVRVDNIIENDFVYHSEDYRIKYKTYEKAEDACINKLIELVKTK
jgi:hypothetical protein